MFIGYCAPHLKPIIAVALETEKKCQFSKISIVCVPLKTRTDSIPQAYRPYVFSDMNRLAFNSMKDFSECF